MVSARGQQRAADDPRARERAAGDIDGARARGSRPCAATVSPASSPPSAASPPARRRVSFTDVTARPASSSPTTADAPARSSCPRPWARACAFFDADGDGWLDILLVNGKDWTPRGRRIAAGALPQQPQRHVHRRHRAAAAWTSRCTAWAWPSATTTTTAATTSTSPRSTATACSTTRAAASSAT